MDLMYNSEGSETEVSIVKAWRSCGFTESMITKLDEPERVYIWNGV